MSEQLPQPGWYHNAQGQTQWWDGTAWGMLAEDYVQEPAPTQTAVEQASEPLQAASVGHVTEPAQPVAQDFSREFLEQRYGAGDRPAVTSAEPATPAEPIMHAATPAEPAYPAYAHQAHHQAHHGQYDQYGYAQASSAPNTLSNPSSLSGPKPPIHMFTWVSFASAAVALLSAIVAGSYFIGVLFGLAWLAILAALVFGILAIIQSQKKPLPIVATAIAATGFIWVPIVQVLSVLISARAGSGVM